MLEQKRPLWRGVASKHLPMCLCQDGTGDNNDTNEETLGGKRTTYATTLVLYQRRQFGPVPMPRVYAEQTKRKRSLQSSGVCQFTRQYSAYGKRHAVASFSWDIMKSCIRQCVWWIMLGHWWGDRMKLFEVELFSIEKQKLRTFWRISTTIVEWWPTRYSWKPCFGCNSVSSCSGSLSNRAVMWMKVLRQSKLLHTNYLWKKGKPH